jgi:hypothetical protein
VINIQFDLQPEEKREIFNRNVGGKLMYRYTLKEYGMECDLNSCCMGLVPVTVYLEHETETYYSTRGQEFFGGTE